MAAFDNWLSPRCLSQKLLSNIGALVSARASIWLDEITRKLVEYFSEDLPKPELVSPNVKSTTVRTRKSTKIDEGYDDYMIGIPNISRLSYKLVTLPLLLVISTGHHIKWDHLEILATAKSDLQCRIKETLLISDLKSSLNENVGREKLLSFFINFYRKYQLSSLFSLVTRFLSFFLYLLKCF